MTQIKHALRQIAEQASSADLRELAKLLGEVCQHVEAAAQAAENAGR